MDQRWETVAHWEMRCNPRPETKADQMGNCPFIKFYPSDFLGGTSGLSPAERGCYITLLCLIFEADGPIERDDSRLARRCGAPKAAFVRILKALKEEGKLYEIDGHLTNRRAEKALMDRANRTQNSTYAANQRWSAQREKEQQKQGRNDAPAMPPQCGGTCQPEPEPEKKEREPYGSPKKAKKSAPKTTSHPLPEDWSPDMDKARALMEEFQLSRDDMNYCYQQMKGHAHAKDRKLVDWDAGFANWVRQAVKFGEIGPNARNRGGGGNRGIPASFFDF